MREQHLAERAQFEALFRESGLEHIQDALLILDAFLDTEEHMTVRELQELLARREVRLSEQFIEDTLALFCRFGLAQRTEFSGQEPRYEHRHLGRHHDHLVCTKCGRIAEFYDPEVEALQRRLTLEMGFYPLQHRMEIYGICGNCARRRRQLLPLALSSPGERVRLEGFMGKRRLQQRLAEMGLQPGSEMEVISACANGGPFIVAAKGARLALGCGMAQKIMVSLIKPDRDKEG